MLKPRPADVKNIRDYGAVGDGVTDDSNAIRKAIGWVALTTNGATVAGNATLHFASVPTWLTAGTPIYWLHKAPHALDPIPGAATVSSITSNTVVMSLAATDEGVACGALIGFGNTHVGAVYFPPGDYRVNSQIELPHAGAGEGSFVIFGCGQASSIFAGFTGYVFNRDSHMVGVGGCDSEYAANGGLFSITDLSFRRSTGAPCGIKLRGCVVVNLERLVFREMHIGIFVSVSNFNVAVRECDFRGEASPPVPGSYGIVTGATFAETIGGAGSSQGVYIHNCTAVCFDNGYRIGGSGEVKGCRAEECNIGYHLGVYPDADSSYSIAVIFESYGEACGIGIYARSVGKSIVRGGHHAQPNHCAGTVTSSAAGVKVLFGNDSEFSLINITGYYQTVVGTGGFVFEPGGDTTGALVRAVSAQNLTDGGTAWCMPMTTTKAGVRFLDSNNPDHELLSCELPGQPGVIIKTPSVGMQYAISDCNTSTWGETAAGGGANRVLVRYNGTAWTVVGR